MDYSNTWQFAKAARTRPASIGAYVLDLSHSNPNAVVYHNPQTKHSVISFSGTRLSDDPNYKGSWITTDIATDIQLFLGVGAVSKSLRESIGVGKRYNEAIDFTSQVASHYGKNNITVVGHSLGGVLAMEASHALHLPASVINPGIPRLTAWQHGSKDYSQVTAYYNEKDPISVGTGDVHPDTGIISIPI